MNRIAKRTAATLVLIALLLGGVGWFCVDYFLHSGKWVMTPGSPHVFLGGNIGCGIITDRDGTVILDTSDGRLYSGSEDVRKSMLHWVGDRYGYISAPAVSTYAQQMAGFDPINGLYSYQGAGMTQLTLSARLQATALRAMGDAKGTVAVYNYKTGQLLCAVSTPTYDPDAPPQITAENQNQYDAVYMNRFTKSAYIPGSVFKLVTMAAALEEIPNIREQIFTCTGSYAYPTKPVTCEKVHGKLDLDSALAQSCNCAFAAIVDQLGPERLEYYVKKYGVTAPITFDGITTGGGNFDLTNAGKDQIAWSGIGQHKDQVNPCAFMTFVGAIANDGMAVKPYVVEQVTCGGNVTYSAQSQTMERIMPAEIARELQAMMRNNVVEKYGEDKFPGLTVCAKSGTGQMDNKDSNAVFSGFVADEAYPLAFFIVVEEGGYGRHTCIPILQPILEECKLLLSAGA